MQISPLIVAEYGGHLVLGLTEKQTFFLTLINFKCIQFKAFSLFTDWLGKKREKWAYSKLSLAQKKRLEIIEIYSGFCYM